ncbi:hypothetical protein H9L01_10370 [Erysipelothrix inopinata]|uniref:Uncharacterized protein n=2 Tax=Erysipelothrix inopinata TaxID=225084 RepID=A0A7G9RYS5_9FIRM|nr:hypothetical protein [Erysipelothrix inopinata]QNN60750.1 hypothetical protein H9L01_10370 [Erysipelothrix inopinata]
MITENDYFEKSENMILKSFSEHNNFNDYELNIIDLNNEKIWSNYGRESYESSRIWDPLHCLQDFDTISKQMDICKKKILILLPQNINFTYGYEGSEAYDNYLEYSKLKDCLNYIPDHLADLDKYISYQEVLIFSPTQTRASALVLNSDFSFSDSISVWEDVTIKRNCNDNTITAIFTDNICRTTMKCNDNLDLEALIEEMGLLEKEKPIEPEWMESIEMFDDKDQKSNIFDNQNIISNAEREIINANSILKKNSELKSILYTQSKELEKVVLEILEELFDCNLTDFIDLKEEDFSFQYGNNWYVGEIKGVTSNIRSENISQLDVHYQTFLERNPNINSSNVFSLLIMNHQRRKSPDKREPVHENQIKLAKRNESLIVDTEQLLKILEKFRNNEFTREDVVILLSDKENGIVQI